ncbi:MAG: FkbM family methyltransferase, partial [Pseudomonadota bacterium]
MASSFLPSAAQLFEKLPRALRRHRLITGWMALTGENPLQLVRIRDRAFGFADLRDGFLRLIVIEGDFETDFFRIADALLARGGTFLDVGANHGLLSLGLADRWRDKVAFHLFEPNEELRDSFARSQALYPGMQVTLNPYAVSDKPGTLQIHFQPGHLGMSHVVPEGGVSIRAIRLDDYLAEKSIDSVELMKIDIEGFELAGLKGADAALGRQAIKAIYFEYCEKWLRRHHPPAELLEYLKSRGYEPCLVRECDLAQRGASHRLRDDIAGAGLLLRPLGGTP